MIQFAEGTSTFKSFACYKTRFLALAGTVLSLMAALGVTGQSAAASSGAAKEMPDWPQWRGATRDGKVNGFVTPDSWPIQLAQKWKKTVGLGDATPALVGGRLFVFARQGEDEVLLCLDANDGKDLWRNQYAAQKVTGAAASYPGPRSSPAVAGGKVVTMGVGGVVSCVDAVTGKLVWRNDEFTNTLPMFFTATSPLLEDGMCIVHLGGKDQGALVAFDLATGTQKWKWTGDGPAYASPTVMKVGGSKQIVLQTESHLRGLTLTEGKPLWQVATTPAEPGYWSSVTPVIDGAMVIYSGQGHGMKALRIVEQGNGFGIQELWKIPKPRPRHGRSRSNRCWF